VVAVLGQTSTPQPPAEDRAGESHAHVGGRDDDDDLDVD
jgi:hypothetical protein